MSPSVATIGYVSLILALFLLERDSGRHTSSALWIPVIWLSICASRWVSQWLGVVGSEDRGALEGNPLDALIFSGLLALGLMVLIARRQRVSVFLRTNWPLLAFLAYCGLSAIWSDYPLPSFKRWTKAVGDLVMILIVVTDPDPTAAIKRFFSRPAFLLIPLSILFIKYYPSVGRGYSSWTGEAFNLGVATQKNGLGFICLVFGLAALWCFLEAMRNYGRIRMTRTTIASVVILVLALWLFQMAHSATSFACFLIGSAFITVTTVFGLYEKPVVVQFLVGGVLFAVVYGLILNPTAGLAEIAGRDATLTGRTTIWNRALDMVVNPVLGTGYESFWAGERLEKMSGDFMEPPSQAHNGYIDVYLNLGWVGVVLLVLVMIRGYRSIIGALSWGIETDRLKLAFLVVAAIYNLTEHAFREMHPVWIMFLLAVTVIPDDWRPEAS